MKTENQSDDTAAKSGVDSSALFGWTPLRDSTQPPKDMPFEVLHFGNPDGIGHIVQDGKFDDFGPIGIPECEGDHCKRQTITHWRLKPNTMLSDEAKRSSD